MKGWIKGGLIFLLLSIIFGIDQLMFGFIKFIRIGGLIDKLNVGPFLFFLLLMPLLAFISGAIIGWCYDLITQKAQTSTQNPR